MQTYIANRLVWLVIVLFGLTLMTFVITNVIPGDAALAAAGFDAPQEQVEKMRQVMGLDKPLPEQYFRYLWRLLHGDLGTAGRSRQPVLRDLRIYVPATIELSITAMILYVLIGIPLGVVGALRRGSLLDKGIDALSIFGVAMPAFWLGLMLQLVLYNRLGWFPGTGRLAVGLDPPTRITGMYVIDSVLTGNGQALASALKHLVLPAVTLTVASLGNITRVTRRSVLGVLTQDYIRTARAKGLQERSVIYGHALRTALIPVVTIVGLQAGFVLSGAVLVEIIFSWPGIGKYLFDSIAFMDFQPIMGTILLIGVIFVVINLIVDLAYVVIDPRIVHR
jgi:ABC-type dipeptide/oligopeptide/nickel transport system permease component